MTKKQTFLLSFMLENLEGVPGLKIQHEMVTAKDLRIRIDLYVNNRRVCLWSIYYGPRGGASYFCTDTDLPSSVTAAGGAADSMIASMVERLQALKPSKRMN
jgi:hypothetical protein